MGRDDVISVFPDAQDEETKIIQEQAPLEAELSNLVKSVEDAKNKGAMALFEDKYD